MKKLILFFSIFVAIISTSCSTGTGKKITGSDQKQNNNGNSEIIFREYEHAFGNVDEGEKVSCIFTFDNRGNQDLIISSVITTCGCTIPKYNTKPIPPGGTGNIEVVFDTSGRSGMQTKTITVKSNAKTPVVLLKITADVETTNN